MQTDAYSHSIEINEDNRTLSIFRILNGTRQFYTSVQLPDGYYDKNPEEFKKFFRLLGENIFLDSPQGRRCVGWDDSVASK